MASHHITIAKASFTASCLRPDTTQLTRDEISRFHTILEATLLKCSPSNVQTCKKWLLENVVPSSHRIAALSKYLISLSKHASNIDDESGISASRKRLHILYILNDVLHHEKYHAPGVASQEITERTLETNIVEMFQLATSQKRRNVSRRLQDLIHIWKQEKYFSTDVLDLARQVVAGDKETSSTASNVTEAVTVSKELPFVMPTTHGDPTTPYYDLPAANLMPHIVPNKAIPMRPDQIRALQLSAGPADESLVNAVKDFLKDVERIDNQYQSLEDEGIVADMDDLGQLRYANETEDVVGDTYYGWSRDFCIKMKQRSKEENGSISRMKSRSMSRSRSRSRSRSDSRSKRRRYDSSRSRSRSRSRSQSQSRRRLRSLSPSRSPVRQPVSFQQTQAASTLYQQSASMNTPVQNPNSLYPPIPISSNGFPIPPPRPPNYSGPWPPPPPPPPPPPSSSHSSGYHNLPFSALPHPYPGPGASQRPGQPPNQR